MNFENVTFLWDFRPVCNVQQQQAPNHVFKQILTEGPAKTLTPTQLSILRCW